MPNKIRGLMILTVMSVAFLYVHVRACVEAMYWAREDIFTVMTLACIGCLALTFRQYQKVILGPR